MLRFIIHRRDGLARMTLALGLMAAAAAFALASESRSGGPRLFGTANASVSGCSSSQLGSLSGRFACGDLTQGRKIGGSISFQSVRN
jgi:hypothetical protein